MDTPAHEFTIWDSCGVSEMRVGPHPTPMHVWDVRDDDDYSEPTRRMIVAAPTSEAAEAMWDDPHTADNAYARPVLLRGWPLEMPGTERVLYGTWLASVNASEAA